MTRIRHDWFNVQLISNHHCFPRRLHLMCKYCINRLRISSRFVVCAKYNILINPFGFSRWQKLNSSQIYIVLCSVQHYTQLFYKLLDRSFFVGLQMDRLQPKPKRRQASFCSLMSFQLPADCTKEAAWWHDERTVLFCLCCCLSLSLIKGNGPVEARGGGSDSAVCAEKYQQSAILQKEMSFRVMPALPGAAALHTRSYLPYTGSPSALNEPGSPASQRQRPLFHWKRSALAELKNDN